MMLESKSSHMPAAMRASKLADNGTIKSVWAQRRSSICNMLAPLVQPGLVHSSWSTCRPSTLGMLDNAARLGCSEACPARKWVAALVSTTRMDKFGLEASAEMISGSLMHATDPLAASRRCCFPSPWLAATAAAEASVCRGGGKDMTDGAGADGTAAASGCFVVTGGRVCGIKSGLCVWVLAMCGKSLAMRVSQCEQRRLDGR